MSIIRAVLASLSALLMLGQDGSSRQLGLLSEDSVKGGLERVLPGWNAIYATSDIEYSANWAGWSLRNFETGNLYTQIQGEWMVPRITLGDSVTPPIRSAYLSIWVGIGGSCLNSRCNGRIPGDVDNTLIQAGTFHQVYDNGARVYYAWYQLVGTGPQIPIKDFVIRPGNLIRASITCTALCSEPKQSWRITLENLTTRQKPFVKNVEYRSSRASAEWIVEDPEVNRSYYPPLAGFGREQMYVTQVNKISEPDLISTLFNRGEGYYMLAFFGETAETSALSISKTVNRFNVCWGFLNLTRCPAPRFATSERLSVARIRPGLRAWQRSALDFAQR